VGGEIGPGMDPEQRKRVRDRIAPGTPDPDAFKRGAERNREKRESGGNDGGSGGGGGGCLIALLLVPFTALAALIRKVR
jgi:hypothetical protein